MGIDRWRERERERERETHTHRKMILSENSHWRNNDKEKDFHLKKID